MRRVILVVGWLALVGAGAAVAKEPGAGSKQTGRDAKEANIKDEEAVRCILTRLEEQTGAKDWKIELKELAGASREFVAKSGQRSEQGTVNVAKSYPNPGALRVYLIPRD